MESQIPYHTALDWLAWQVELGADEAIAEAPVNRFEAAAVPVPVPNPVATPASTSAPAASAIAPPAEGADPVAEARKAATRAGDLAQLAAEMEGFAHCDLRHGARTFVFCDGNPAARVMIVGEAPGREEDMQGKPFVGRAGQLLDRMFDAIGLNRASPDAKEALYITNILPWRPPQNRDPSPAEIAMMLPFVQRHIDLAAPEVIVLMGNISCQGLLGRRGITRLRGTWQEVMARPAMPMFHPAFLLRQPPRKREAWADLLSIQSKLRG
ncbi:MAG: uracil-DNA glycosylase [Rhodobacteraceae bacterium CG17_big_fil_post_rev_8_21_14_2_50_65_11]|nr:MAG: uracil-DNA glycosylase [Rhodobacteraceae bacterium CG17_big_fil_post_rev_8_21_14_2_50_65_11]